MIATFLIDAPSVALVGMVAGVYGPAGHGRVFYARAAAVWAFLAGVAFFGTALWSYALEPDWMWMGFLDPETLGAGAIVYVAILLYLVPLVAGYALGCARRDAGIGPITPGLLLVGLQILVIRVLWRRYWPIPDNSRLTVASAVGFGAVAVLLGIGVTLGVIERRHKPRSQMPHWQRVGRVIQVMAEALYPPLNISKYHAGQEDLGGRAVLLVASLPPPGRLAFRALMRALEVSPPFFLGRPRTIFTLDLRGRMQLWQSLLTHRFRFVRAGAKLLKVAIAVHYYEREDVLEEIGTREEDRFAAPGSTTCAIGKKPPRRARAAR